MPDRPNPVSSLQHHLRQAGAAIAARQFDAASTHLDAAFAIDPASLAAITLRERLQKAWQTQADAFAGSEFPSEHFDPQPALRDAAAPRFHDVPAVDAVDEGRRSPAIETAAAPPVAAAPIVDEIVAPPSAPGRFIPSGVDAASWLDFEHRIQDRRFKALVASAERAMEIGDGIAARLAIEEARELRPDGPELADLSERAALLPLVPPSAGADARYVRVRAMRAVSILLFGVGLLIGIDWIQSDAADAFPDVPSTAATPVADLTRAEVAASSARAPSRSVSLDNGRFAEVAREVASSGSAPAGTTATSGTAAIDTAAVPNAATARAAAVPTLPLAAASPVRDASRTTPQVMRRSAGSEVPDDYVAVLREPVPALPRPGGEVPDNYVAPQPTVVRADTPMRQPEPPRTAAGLGNPVANVPRQGGSVLDGVGTRSSPATPASAPPAPAAAAASAVIVTRERQRVHSVLQQYADAYDRLDARAVRAVYPTVKERDLSRAFAGLASQRVDLGECEIELEAEGSAHASCEGSASYVGRIGSNEMRTERRTYAFDLTLDGDEWKIERAEARR